MDINEIITSDAALDVIDNGAWVGDLPGFDGIRLKVCGMQSQEVRKALESKQAKLRSKNSGKPLTTEQHAEATRQVLGEVVLKDWDGFTQNGEPVPFDRAQAKKWVTTRNGEKLANLAFFAAQRIDNEASSFVEAVEKNS